MCDTEDWSNDAENQLCLANYFLNCNNISQFYSFYCVFDQINEALISIRDFFLNFKKSYQPQTFELNIE